MKAGSGKVYKKITAQNLKLICDKLSNIDPHLKLIISMYGYPPFWNRDATFSTLLHIILEQQVSLESAKAAFIKLGNKIKIITPENLLLLTDEELKACYFSRQKIKYVRDLAEKILSKELNLTKLSNLDDETIRNELKKIKGIGDWTANIFLMFALQRCDCFPHGDIALIKTIKEIKELNSETTSTTIISITNKWAPYRTVASYILWHFYLCKRNRDV